jgi:DNA-directed RNA polymerase subunit beta'
LLDVNEFSSLRIGLATADQIRNWSNGEVKKPETINYRTLKPEKEGLFCEKIFGPTRDWECSCGKYKKRVRFKGMICERCGVEVTRSKVRRERMGHIELAAAVSHIWFFKGVPSRMGYLLDLPSKSLERVLYFASYIVVDVKKDKREKELPLLQERLDGEVAELEGELAARHKELIGEELPVFTECLELYIKDAKLPEKLKSLSSRLTEVSDQLASMETPERKELEKKVRDLEAERDKQIKAVERESKKKAAENPKTKEVRIEEITAQYGSRIQDENDAYVLMISKMPDSPAKEMENQRERMEKDREKLSTQLEEGLSEWDARLRDIEGPLGTIPAEPEDGEEPTADERISAMNKRTGKIRRLVGDRQTDEKAELDARVKEMETERDKLIRAIGRESKKKAAEFPKTKEERIADLEKQHDNKVSKEYAAFEKKVKKMRDASIKEMDENREQLNGQLEYLRGLFEDFRNLDAKQLIDEDQKFRDLRERYADYFRGGMGAETVRDLLLNLNLEKEGEELRETIKTSKGQKRNKATKRLKVVSAFLKTDNRPEAMILDVVPVIPPDLRPMVQLDGGRFATSDLNDLYRRVINRNNRLKRLLDLGAPEIIVNNEKRMLQEAVDALFDNGRRGRPVTGPGNRPLKSLSDMLKGKQGRFRQNLLGKRVDYSGRSVIVVGPELKLHQCGLPKQMALELFKPFVMKRLVDLGFAHNIKGAKRMIDRMVPIVWDVLEKVIQEHPVFLNRAPTLHRLGIQAFEPLLVEGKAIRIHPLVCTAFNADFDGDQMAVHLPLSAEAQAEARILMLSAHNILSPAHGRPIVSPTQDMVLGCYFLNAIKEGARGEGKVFSNPDQAVLAQDFGQVHLQALIKVRMDGEIIETSTGRIIFNRALPEDFPYQNRPVGKKEIAEIIEQVADAYDSGVIARILDQIKEIGFHYATRAGVTISVEDIEVPPEKPKILEEAEKKIGKIEEEYGGGFLTEEERHSRVVEVWHDATDLVATRMEENFDQFNPIYMMARSGARGDLKQIKQLAGMKGLVEDPKGEIIASPITSNFRQGLTVLEYFISTHGARKGLADTALRTADSGYLTRRLVDVAQDVIVREEDCGTDRGIPARVLVDGEINPSVLARNSLEKVRTRKGVILEANQNIGKAEAQKLADQEIEEVRVRSVLTCRAKHGVCSACYGRNLATGGDVPMGEAVGIIAAQSIGEPGTQLTMRTFHFGGVYAGAGRDITHGLPRVVELFEARKPKGQAYLAWSRGKIEIKKGEKYHEITLHGEELDDEGKSHPRDYEYQIPVSLELLVKDGEDVAAGTQITEGSADPKELLEIVNRESVQLYLVSEVQRVYKDQGVDIHDKHIEIIVRQMLKRVTVSDPGDSEFLPGQLVDYMEFEEEAKRVVAEGGEPPRFKEVLLGITKASLATESFLSAASFQETTRVLTDAALSGKVDRLLGLKENVIIGKLIPTGSGMKQYRRINVKPLGEEWEPLYTGEQLPELQPPLDAMDIFRMGGIPAEDLNLGDEDDLDDEDSPRSRARRSLKGDTAGEE